MTTRTKEKRQNKVPNWEGFYTTVQANRNFRPYKTKKKDTKTDRVIGRHIVVVLGKVDSHEVLQSEVPRSPVEIGIGALLVEHEVRVVRHGQLVVPHRGVDQDIVGHLALLGLGVDQGARGDLLLGEGELEGGVGVEEPRFEVPLDVLLRLEPFDLQGGVLVHQSIHEVLHAGVVVGAVEQAPGDDGGLVVSIRSLIEDSPWALSGQRWQGMLLVHIVQRIDCTELV